MNKVMASAGLLALGVMGVQKSHAQLIAGAGAEKPWNLSGTLRGFYDDNPNLVPSNPTGGAFSGVSKNGSYGVEIRPSISINLQLEPTTIQASYLFSGRWFESRTPYKWDYYHDFELAVDHRFSDRYSIDFDDSFVDTAEPTLLDKYNSAVTLRSSNNNIRNNAAVNFHGQATPLFGYVIGYANTFYKFDQTGNGSIGAALDRDENLITLESRWTINEENIGLFGYHFTATENLSGWNLNADPTHYANPNIRNSYYHDIYGGLEHTFNRDLTGTVRVGATYADYYNSTQSASWSPYVDLSATYAYLDTGSVTFGFTDMRNQTDNTGQNLGNTPYVTADNVTLDQESRTVYGTIVHKITPSLTGQITAQYQDSLYGGSSSSGYEDKFLLLGVNASYQFTHYVSGEVGYNYDDLCSGIPNRGYDRNRVYLGVTASY